MAFYVIAGMCGAILILFVLVIYLLGKIEEITAVTNRNSDLIEQTFNNHIRKFHR